MSGHSNLTAGGRLEKIGKANMTRAWRRYGVWLQT
jgi:hypothetical protein